MAVWETALSRQSALVVQAKEEFVLEFGEGLPVGLKGEKGDCYEWWESALGCVKMCLSTDDLVPPCREETVGGGGEPGGAVLRRGGQYTSAASMRSDSRVDLCICTALFLFLF